MSIAQLLELNQLELQSISSKIDTFELHVEENEVSITKEEEEEEEEDDEYQKTHQEITRIDAQLALLDKLWYIRGYLAEIELYLALTDVEEAVDQYSAVKDITSKMSEAIQGLPPCLIKLELHQTHTDYEKRIEQKVSGIFFPLEGVFRVLKPVDSKIVNAWDELLSRIIGGTTAAVFDDEHQVLTSSLTQEDKYVDSLVAFMMFIDACRSDKNKFRSKINHSMVNYLSLHITKLPNLAKLRQLCGSWNIQISDLDELYYNWQTDQYIDRVRKIFMSPELGEWVNQLYDISSSPNQVSNTQNSNNDWDNWDEAWDEEEDDEQQHKTSLETDKPKVMISQVAHKIVEAIIDFNNPNIFDSVKALASVLYPSYMESFVMFNDLHYIAEQIQAATLARFADNYWTQQLAGLDTEILEILREIGVNKRLANVTEEDSDSSDDGTLDDVTVAKFSKLHQKLKSLSDSQLHYTNTAKYHDLASHIVKLINTYFIHSIYLLEDIGQVQATKIGNLVDACNKITIAFVGSKREELLYHKLDNVKFIVGGHLADILDRFYRGELYDLDTEEITALIESTFTPSERRERAIQEITEFRRM
ncbi:uncharacterized protein KQ657_002081 [Scheffersomyces spartinae]|uniref:Retrograde transport protein Dsl1 C-terminal domain-containing protein n=1 Tax=Scheffersomyces spartinae TaxID=45513 RepID=A0A9P7VD82_9ASCO|nr:uncharacterized protein KQ657_002081 [Scheffersomyces spartinae]KAG7195699.1 hypothetical protein KQ657_002081 [Scheffersomyces spartinae]